MEKCRQQGYKCLPKHLVRRKRGRAEAQCKIPSILRIPQYVWWLWASCWEVGYEGLWHSDFQCKWYSLGWDWKQQPAQRINIRNCCSGLRDKLIIIKTEQSTLMLYNTECGFIPKSLWWGRNSCRSSCDSWDNNSYYQGFLSRCVARFHRQSCSLGITPNLSAFSGLTQPRLWHETSAARKSSSCLF